MDTTKQGSTQQGQATGTDRDDDQGSKDGDQSKYPDQDKGTGGMD